MSILVSFMGKDTPEFDGRVKHMSKARWKGNVPFYATHFVTDDDNIRATFEKEGVIEYGKAQEKQEWQEEEQVITDY